MNIYNQPDILDSLSSNINASSQIDIVLSYGDKMPSPNESPSPEPSSDPFENYLSADIDMDVGDILSPAQFLAPTPSRAPASPVGSPASSMHPSSPAGQDPGRSASASASTITPAKGKVCSVCKKTFARRCDLNRHKKIHDRPFKCQIEGCEFKTRGFPTDQERKRHVNDRHSDSPSIYNCTWEGCSYSSKRKSNLKQHEEAHEWKYYRSRSSACGESGLGGGAEAEAEAGAGAIIGSTSPFFASTPTLVPCTSASTPSTSYLLQTPALSQMGCPFGSTDEFDLSLDLQIAPLIDPSQYNPTSSIFTMGAHTPTHGLYAVDQLDMGSGTAAAATTPVHAAWEELVTEHELGRFLMSTESQIDLYSDPQYYQHQHQHQQGHVLTSHGWIV